MSDSAVLLYLSVTKSDCVTQLLINPIIRTRSRHFSGVYHPTRHSIKIKVKGKAMPEQVVEANGVVRRRGFHIF
jgi:hypothetical protein